MGGVAPAVLVVFVWCRRAMGVASVRGERWVTGWFVDVDGSR